MARSLTPERRTEIIRGTTKKDNVTAAEYMRILRKEGGLRRMIERNRPPHIVFHTEVAHIVFPPSSMISGRGNKQIVSSFRYYWETPEYVFHSEKYRGPKTVCSYKEVSLSEGVEVCQQMIQLFIELGNEDLAARYAATLARLTNTKEETSLIKIPVN